MDCVFLCLNCIQAVRGSRHEETGSNYRRRVGQAGKKPLNKSHFQTPTFGFFFLFFLCGVDAVRVWAVLGEGCRMVEMMEHSFAENRPPESKMAAHRAQTVKTSTSALISSSVSLLYITGTSRCSQSEREEAQRHIQLCEVTKKLFPADFWAFIIFLND